MLWTRDKLCATPCVEVVGAGHVLDDPSLTAQYETDWTGRFGGRALLVVRPANVAEVAEVVDRLRGCRRAGDPPGRQHRPGRRRRAVRATVARSSISLTRLIVDRRRRLGARPRVGGRRRDAAPRCRSAARAAGFDAGLDFAARDSCTIGGVVACNAGGARALRHGTARGRVAGLEAVLADGSVITRMAGLTKDNAGYDLPSLLVGSEGTLAIVTRVLWKLELRCDARVAALVPLPSADAAAALLAALRAEAPTLESCEFFLDEGLQLVLSHLRRSSPLAQPSPSTCWPSAPAASTRPTSWSRRSTAPASRTP